MDLDNRTGELQRRQSRWVNVLATKPPFFDKNICLMTDRHL